MRESLWSNLQSTLTRPGYLDDQRVFWMPTHWRIALLVRTLASKCKFTFKSDPHLPPNNGHPAGRNDSWKGAAAGPASRTNHPNSFNAEHLWLLFLRCPMRRSCYSQRAGSNSDANSLLYGSSLHAFQQACHTGIAPFEDGRPPDESGSHPEGTERCAGLDPSPQGHTRTICHAKPRDHRRKTHFVMLWPDLERDPFSDAAGTDAQNRPDQRLKQTTV